MFQISEASQVKNPTRSATCPINRKFINDDLVGAVESGIHFLTPYHENSSGTLLDIYIIYRMGDELNYRMQTVEE